ncbi:MAG: ATP-binding protein, partial [Saprospiraceae bacterium]|nr:ATP-binding protein [Saprospiraceae bacterium]
MEINIPINPGRVLFGLSRIGYTPSSAICDIIDNSIMAKANNIYIHIERDNERYADNRKGNVKEYLIIDDGNGCLLYTSRR